MISKLYLTVSNISSLFIAVMSIISSLPFQRAAAAARGLEEALTNNELSMARRNASELIMDITAVNNALTLDTFKYISEIIFCIFYIC